MHERPEDLAALRAVIDASYEHAGAHLQAIHAPERRLDAEALAEQLTGMCLLVLATTTRDGHPITGPVDGIFYRGRFHFGSSPDSVRFRHIRSRPEVSATHLPGEHLAVTVHGTAEVVDVGAPEHAELRQTLLDIYLPRYGDDWLQVLNGATYARIHPRRMFTFSMPELDAGAPPAAPPTDRRSSA
ncbi:MAG: pyridoxamine 5'-phosphate oxidase family protein [Ilumatobacteraceae bacterium]|nr:pyridoxamine 5'-phosphate oxidase family protein [Ilumatobacteraceae bacterium]